MPVEDVFSITGRGTVATGRIEAGRVKVGDEVQILGLGADKKSVVTGVEVINSLHKLHNLVFPLGLTVESTKSRTTDDRSVVTVILILRKKVTHIHLNEFKHLLVVNHVTFVHILGLGADKKSVVTGVEMFRKILDEGEAGDNVGLLLRGIDKDEIKRGMVICHPGQVKPHDHFKAQVYILKKEEGGRHTPFHNKYRPQFYIRTLDVTGEITLPEGIEMVMPGDNVEIDVKLITPVAMDNGLRFAIREGGRTVGSGQITAVVED